METQTENDKELAIKNAVKNLTDNFDASQAIELCDGIVEALLFQEHKTGEKLKATYWQYKLIDAVKNIFNESKD